MKAILINNQIQYFQNFTTFENAVNVQSATEQQIYDWGFRDVVVPIITDSQIIGEMYFNKDNDVWTYKVIDKTPKEIEAENIAIKKDERNTLLRKGIIVDGVWFNEEYLGNFTSAITLKEKSGSQTIFWKDDLDVWIELSISDAYILANKAMMELQKIYLNDLKI
jgi:hypothetical protein